MLVLACKAGSEWSKTNSDNRSTVVVYSKS